MRRGRGGISRSSHHSTGRRQQPEQHQRFGEGERQAGNHDTALACAAMRGRAPSSAALHHYTYWVAYQPHDRLQLFQFAVAAILLAAAAALTLAATWLLRRHPPE